MNIARLVPIPLVEPVTSAVLPFRSVMALFDLSWAGATRRPGPGQGRRCRLARRRAAGPQRTATSPGRRTLAAPPGPGRYRPGFRSRPRPAGRGIRRAPPPPPPDPVGGSRPAALATGSWYWRLTRRWFRLAGSHRGRAGLGGQGGWWLRAGEVGAADPDHGEVDDQGEQRDPGGDQEPAAEPGGEGVVVDRCGRRPAGMCRVPGPRGVGGLGVDAVGDDGPGHGAEHRQADGAAGLLAGVEQAGGHPGVGFGDAVQRDPGRGALGLGVWIPATGASSTTAGVSEARTWASPQWETPSGLVAALTRP